MPVPLDKLMVTFYNENTKREEEVPALHPRWVKNIEFVCYQPPPLNFEDVASINEWKERVEFIIEDLHWLLKLPHDKFWCQVIFDKSLHRCIDSYLKNAPRCYDVYDLLPEMQELENELHRLVYISCVRMATHKESKEHFFTPEEFGKILYENYIFDIPRLMDLAVLYGASSQSDGGNRPLLTKMITNIFTQQPNYENDLIDAIPTILHVFKNISVKCGVDSINLGQTPPKLGQDSVTPLHDLDARQFQDIIFYLMDTLFTIWTFIDIYPAACKAFVHEDFLIKMAGLYENLFPSLESAMNRRTWTSDSHYDLLVGKLRLCQLCVLKIFRHVISHNYLNPLLDDSSEEEFTNHAEDYLHFMSGVLAEKWFLSHLNYLYPFRDDRDILLQCRYPVDETRLQFILDAVNEAAALHAEHLKNMENIERGSSPEGATSDKDPSYSGIDYEAPDTEDMVGACAAVKQCSEVEIRSMISSVLDLLPDLGEGFIQLCLEEMNYDLEKVIHMLLEDNLPPSLQECSRDLPRQEKIMPDEEPNDVLSMRQNVFDNDKFDVFSRDDVDTSCIHKGKKERNADEKAILDDKSAIAVLKPLYDKYGHEDVESIYDQIANEYEDEYDDTYDTNMIGATDTNDMDELTARRPFTVPRVLAVQGSTQRNDDSESDEEEQQEQDAPKRDLFIEDPAKIREQREQRWAAREQRKKKSRGPGRSQGQHAEGEGQAGEGQGHKVYDVKGNAKGKGQSSEVLHNRAWKEKHKASRVHHNRKALADRKRKV